MRRSEIGRIVAGQHYSYYRGGIYLVLGIALNPVTLQELVVYQGSEGTDEGKLFVCSLYDFAAKFSPAGIVRPPDPPGPEKVVDLTIRGSGV